MTSLQQVVVGVAGLLAIVYVVSGSGDTSNGSNGDGSVGFADAGTRGGASAQELASANNKLWLVQSNMNRLLPIELEQLRTGSFSGFLFSVPRRTTARCLSCSIFDVTP